MFQIKVNNAQALKHFIDEIQHIKNDKTKTQVKNDLSNHLIKKIQTNFHTRSEADGTPWKPLKYRQGDPLLLTKRMFNSIKATNTRTGFKIGTNVFYSGWQNNGTQKIPARRFIPHVNEIPKDWFDDMKDIIVKNYIRK